MSQEIINPLDASLLYKTINVEDRILHHYAYKRYSSLKNIFKFTLKVESVKNYILVITEYKSDILNIIENLTHISLNRY
jgi:hypothetical protein